MTKLNLNTFNDILFKAFKEQTPEKKKELLEIEIQMAYGMKIEMMEKVIDDLNKGLPYHEHLKNVNNINDNLDYLAEQRDELEAEGKENEQTSDRL